MPAMGAITRGLSNKLTPVSMGMPPIPQPFIPKKMTPPTNLNTPKGVMTMPQPMKTAAYLVGAQLARNELRQKLAFGGAIRNYMNTMGSGMNKMRDVGRFGKDVYKGVVNQRQAAGIPSNISGRGALMGDISKDMMGMLRNRLTPQEMMAMGGTAAAGLGAGAMGAGYMMGRPQKPTYQLGPLSYNGPSIGDLSGQLRGLIGQ